jgi:hypothetical protein
MLHATEGEKMSKSPEQQHLVDCQKLTKTELRKRYPAEANSHRNLLQRAKNQGRIVHPDFQLFGDFLAHVGPRLCPGATLDRINNADPEYAPGKVRWADKRTQNSNKGDSLIFYYSRTGGHLHNGAACRPTKGRRQHDPQAQGAGLDRR